MGLDTVELVIEVEAEFDIVIANEDAGGLSTVGDVYSYVLRKLGRTEGNPRCGSAVAFYHLRRGLEQCLNVARERVRPTSSSDDLIPRCNRKEAWAKLGQTMGLALPQLHRPRWMVEALGLGLAFSFVSAFLALAMAVPPHDRWLAPSAIMAALITVSLGVAATLATRPFAIEFGSDADSVRALIRTLRRLNNAAFPSSVEGGKDVWERLVIIVSEQAGVERDSLTPDTGFVEDLGMD